MPSFPTMEVRVGFAADPLDELSSITWTDITPYVQRVQTRRGRTHELSRPQAGEATLLLTNRDRRFDPTNTASPYAPHLGVLNRIQILATWAGDTFAIFTGYVESWGPVRWPSEPSPDIEVRCIDAFKVFSYADLLSAWEYEVEADAPIAWWSLGDPPILGDTTAYDKVGGYNGAYVGAVERSTAALVYGSVDKAATLNGIDQYISLATSPLNGAFTIEFWVNANARQEVGHTSHLFDQQHASPGNAFVSVFFNATSGIEYRIGNGDGSATNILNSTTNGLIGSRHHVACTWDGVDTMRIHIDGVLDAAMTGSVLYPVVPHAGSIGGTSTTTTHLAGVVDEFVMYDTILSGPRILAHYNAGANPWAGDTTGDRVVRVLEAVGWPTADRFIDTGLATLQAAAIGGVTALAHLQDVDATEGIMLFIAAGGVVRFLQRDRAAGSPYDTSQATFGNRGPGAGELPYQPGLQYGSDDLDFYTKAKGSRQGGVVLTASAAGSPPRTLSEPTLLYEDDSQVIDRLTFDIAWYSVKRPRVPSLSIRPTDDPANLWPQALGRELWDHVTVHAQPLATGSLFSQEVNVEEISHVIEMGLSWLTTFALTPFNPSTY